MILPQRKQNRLKMFDYSSVNYYFVTVCAKDRKPYFGKIENGKMVENQIGKLARRIWFELPDIFTGLGVDEFVVMPNHVHGILVFRKNPQYRVAGKPATLSKIVGAFKSKTNVFTKREVLFKYSHIQLWQKTFYDRVIRNDDDLLKTREYILNNVAKWELDEYFQK